MIDFDEIESGVHDRYALLSGFLGGAACCLLLAVLGAVMLAFGHMGSVP